MSSNLRTLSEQISNLIHRGEPFVLMTLVDVRGSAPQEIGAKALVGSDGLFYGTIGGGKIEARSISHAKEMLIERKPTDFKVWNLQSDIGMTCGGEVKIFFESYLSKNWTIAIFGAGHVSQALVRTLATLDCKIFAIDHRKEWLDRLPRHTNLQIIHSEVMADEVEKLPADTHIISMTQGHAFDVPILERVLLTRKAPYLGVIGSKVKAIAIRKELKSRGVPEDLLNAFQCPVGLPFGNNTPEEIAISIVAQLLLIRDQISGFAAENDPKVSLPQSLHWGHPSDNLTPIFQKMEP